MNAWIYCADLFCEECGQAIADSLRDEGREDTGDSDDFPQGPYPNGGGKADLPWTCGNIDCCIFLENPLTTDGYNYVREQVRNHWHEGPSCRAVLTEWANFYDIDITEEINA